MIHNAQRGKIEKMFQNTPFGFGYNVAVGTEQEKTSPLGISGIAYGNGYSTPMLREIYINFISNEVRYGIYYAFSAKDKIIIKSFKNFAEIYIPKTLDEFDKLFLS